MEFICLTNNSYVLLDKFVGVSLDAVKLLNQYATKYDFKNN